MLNPFSCTTAEAYLPLRTAAATPWNNISDRRDHTSGLSAEQQHKPMFTGIPPPPSWPRSASHNNKVSYNYNRSDNSQITPYIFGNEPPEYRGYTVIPSSSRNATPIMSGSSNNGYNYPAPQQRLTNTTSSPTTSASMFPDANEREFLSKIDNQLLTHNQQPQSFNDQLLLQQDHAYELQQQPFVPPASQHHVALPPPQPQYYPQQQPIIPPIPHQQYYVAPPPPPQYYAQQQPRLINSQNRPSSMVLYDNSNPNYDYFHTGRTYGNSIQDDMREPETYRGDERYNGNKLSIPYRPHQKQRSARKDFDQAFEELTTELRQALRIRSMKHSSEVEYEFWDRQVKRLNRRFLELQQSQFSSTVPHSTMMQPYQRPSARSINSRPFNNTNNSSFLVPAVPKRTHDSKQQNCRVVKVQSPGDLPEGYQFTARRKGELLLITVPKGGVEKGEIFSVPLVDDDSVYR